MPEVSITHLETNSSPFKSFNGQDVLVVLSERQQLIDTLLSAGVPSPTGGYGLASVNSKQYVDIFISTVGHDLKDRITHFINANGGYCLDIGCGYMTVGRKVAQELGIDYVGVDIIDYGSYMTSGKGTQETLPERNESFHQLDIFSAIHKIGDSQVPCVLLNNFDTSTYLVSGKSLYDVMSIEDQIERDFISQITRVLKIGGFIIAFGTTFEFFQGKMGFESFNGTFLDGVYDTAFYDSSVLVLKKHK